MKQLYLMNKNIDKLSGIGMKKSSTNYGGINNPPTGIYVCISVCLSIYLSVSLYICLLVCICFVFFPVYLSVYLSD